MLKSCSIAVLLIFMASFAHAMSEGCGGDCSKCHTLTLNEAKKLIKPSGGTVKIVRPSKVRGLYEVTFERNGQQVIGYLDYGKRHIISGPVIDLKTMQPISEAAAKPKLKAVSKVDPRKIPLANSIVMGNPMGRRRLIVFTDPDCPYCSKLHQELKKLVAKDNSVAVYIKMFPLVKLHPQAYDKSRAVMAANSVQMLDQTFAGRLFPNPRGKDGKAAVDETLKLAESLGINSTPTMVLPDGSVVTGYWDLQNLRKLLGIKG